MVEVAKLRATLSEYQIEKRHAKPLKQKLSPEGVKVPEYSAGDDNYYKALVKTQET